MITSAHIRQMKVKKIHKGHHSQLKAGLNYHSKVVQPLSPRPDSILPFHTVNFNNV